MLKWTGIILSASGATLANNVALYSGAASSA